MEKERVVEILVAMGFIVLVFIMILVGLNLGNSKTTSSVISNSYNTIDNSQKIYYETKETVKIIKKPVQKTYYYVKDYDKKYYEYYGKDKKTYYYDYELIKKHIWDWEKYPKYKNYDSYGKHIKQYQSRSYADTYKVYVYNNGPGDYFTVRFYFEDYWGNEKTYDIRKYIGFENEKIFYFRDVCKERDEYYSWRYRVLD